MLLLIENKWLLFVVIVVLLYVVALVKHGAPQYFTSIIQSVLSNKTQAQKNKYVASAITTPFYYILYFLTLGFILFQFIIIIKKTHSNHLLGLYFIVVGFVALYFSVKYYGTKLLGWCFRMEQNAQLFLQESSTMDKFIGLFLIPCSIFFMLFPGRFKMPFLILSITLVLIFNVFKYIRQHDLVKKMSRISFFHLLLYLCAFEILPCIMFVRYLKS